MKNSLKYSETGGHWQATGTSPEATNSSGDKLKSLIQGGSPNTSGSPNNGRDILEQLVNMIQPIANKTTNNLGGIQSVGEKAVTQLNLLDALPQNDQILSSLRKTGLLKTLRGFTEMLRQPMLANNLDTGPFNNEDARNIEDNSQKIIQRINQLLKEIPEMEMLEQPRPQENVQETRWQNKPQLLMAAKNDSKGDNDKEEKGKKKKSEPKTSYESKSKQEEDKSKGKKGNPFRVLMGIVGKLLDKGWDSAEIIRHVKKETSFDPKTIKKCVKIVKDYNRKEQRDVEILDQSIRGTMGAHEMLPNIPMIQSMPEEQSESFTSEPMPVDLLRGFAMRQDIRKVFASTVFENAEEKWDRQGVYSIKDDFSKRSTRELIDRMYYLTACKKYDPFTDNGTRSNGPKGSLSSIDGELSEVKTALKERGWDKDDLDCACEIIKSDDHYPFKVTNRE